MVVASLEEVACMEPSWVAVACTLEAQACISVLVGSGDVHPPISGVVFSTGAET